MKVVYTSVTLNLLKAALLLLGGEKISVKDDGRLYVAGWGGHFIEYGKTVCFNSLGEVWVE